MLIGVTGTMASGKDSVSEYLKEKGFFHFSLSDAIRTECDKRGLPKDRDTLRNLGNELREKQGANVLAKLAIHAIATNGAKNTVITSIRNPEEIKLLKKQGDFIFLAVDAPIELRYERTKSRHRESDFIDFETFKNQEEAEMAGGPGKQNLAEVIAMADHILINNSTVEDLRKKINEILKI
ncbi:MAG: AAA family ATPase [Candidatus Omnitrophota bacterium]